MALTWQGPAQAKPGDIVTLTLNGQAAQPINGLGLLVTYDPAVFKALNVNEGGFLRQNNAQPTMTKSIDQDSGQIQVDISGAAKEGASGTGSIVSLLFQALAASPQSQIAVGRIAPVGPGGEALPVTAPEPFAISVAP